MEGSMGVGFMAVFAVSGSVVLVAHQVHKRLFSNFMKTIEFELNGTLYPHAPKRCDEKNMQGKKTVRFAEDVVEPSSDNKEYRKKHHCVAKPALILDKTAVADLDHHHRHRHNQGYRLEDTMPPNRVALYKGILQYRTLKGQHVY
ncbi:hypothetical protein FNV43_RR16699 [Rhamnella rubrinervis]|uniref:Uncharacterized protein n=1 Tax=Rhamnella rubrinervis TaxID=2594499 RepID=A0A8K0GZ92_9ROSA|nr:hypothetical protein FNV43_RR16699 [Rhamnella rubrinervis]